MVSTGVLCCILSSFHHTFQLPSLRQGNFAKFTVGGVAQFPNTGRGVNIVVLSPTGAVEESKTSAWVAVDVVRNAAQHWLSSLYLWTFLNVFQFADVVEKSRQKDLSE